MLGIFAAMMAIGFAWATVLAIAVAELAEHLPRGEVSALIVVALAIVGIGGMIATILLFVAWVERRTIMR